MITALAVLLTTHSEMSGTVVMAADPSRIPDALRLEERIWTADDEQLPTLEREAARRLQLEPYSAYNHFLLSHTYLRMFAKDQQDSESLRTSSDLAAQAVELAPREEFGYVAMVGILEALGQQEKAMAVVNEGLKNVPEGASKWRLVLSLARLMARESNASETMSALLAAMEFPGSIGRVIAPYVVIVEQSRAVSPDQLLQSIRKLALKYPDSGFDETLASLLIEDGRYEQAHNVFTKLRKNPDVSAEILFTDAVLSYRRLGHYSSARRLLEQLKTRAAAAETNPELVSPKKFPALVDAHLGAVYLRSGDFRKAREAFRQAISATDDMTSMVDFVAREYRSAGADKGLIGLLTQIAEEGPGDSVIHAYLGEAQSVRMGNQKAAVASYKNAIILDPTRSDYYNGLGLALYRQLNFEAALVEFSKATEIDPGDASARYNEACALALLGRSEEAMYSLREALQLEPKLIEQAKVDKDFVSINTTASFQQMIAGSVSDELIGATASFSD